MDNHTEFKNRRNLNSYIRYICCAYEYEVFLVLGFSFSQFPLIFFVPVTAKKNFEFVKDFFDEPHFFNKFENLEKISKIRYPITKFLDFIFEKKGLDVFLDFTRF